MCGKHKRFLGFKLLRVDGKERFFIIEVMPFGYNDAGRILDPH